MTNCTKFQRDNRFSIDDWSKNSAVADATPSGPVFNPVFGFERHSRCSQRDRCLDDSAIRGREETTPTISSIVSANVSRSALSREKLERIAGIRFSDFHHLGPLSVKFVYPRERIMDTRIARMSEECNNERKGSRPVAGRGQSRGGDLSSRESQRRLTPEFAMCRGYWRDSLRER